MARYLLFVTLTTAPLLAAPADAEEPTSSAPAATADDPWSAPEIAPQLEPRLVPRRHTEAAPARANAAAAGGQSSWMRTTGALAGVVALILLLGWGYRATLGTGPRAWATRGRQPALLEVVSRTPLAAKQSLCLVRYGPRLVLLGVTGDAIRPLDVISDAETTARLLGEATRRRADSTTAEFARCLEREARSYTDDGGAQEADRAGGAEDERQVAALRDRLADALNRLRARTGGA